MKLFSKLTATLVAIVMMLSLISGCSTGGSEKNGKIPMTSLEIEGEEGRTLGIGDVCLLVVEPYEISLSEIVWTVEGDAVTVDEYGIVVAVRSGVSTATALYQDFSDSVVFTIEESASVMRQTARQQ